MSELIDLSSANWLAIVLAAVSNFLVGGIWYGPLFGRAWMAECGFNEEDLKKRNLVTTFGGALTLALVSSVILEALIPLTATVFDGLVIGATIGIGFVASFLGILYLFEMRSLKAYLINAGYCVMTLGIMGMILSW